MNTQNPIPNTLFVVLLITAILSCGFLGATGYVALRYMERLQTTLDALQIHNEVIYKTLGEVAPSDVKVTVLETRALLQQQITQNTDRIERYAGDRFYKRWFIESAKLNGWKLPKELEEEILE